MSRFSDQLASQIRQVGNPVVVGLDPRWDPLPEELKLPGLPSLQVQAEIFEKFCREVIDVVAPLVPAVKPQMAFFEELGPSGRTARPALKRASGVLNNENYTDALVGSF